MVLVKHLGTLPPYRVAAQYDIGMRRERTHTFKAPIIHPYTVALLAGVRKSDFRVSDRPEGPSRDSLFITRGGLDRPAPARAELLRWGPTLPVPGKLRAAASIMTSS